MTITVTIAITTFAIIAAPSTYARCVQNKPCLARPAKIACSISLVWLVTLYINRRDHRLFVLIVPVL